MPSTGTYGLLVLVLLEKILARFIIRIHRGANGLCGMKVNFQPPGRCDSLFSFFVNEVPTTCSYIHS